MPANTVGADPGNGIPFKDWLRAQLPEQCRQYYAQARQELGLPPLALQPISTKRDDYGWKSIPRTPRRARTCG